MRKHQLSEMLQETIKEKVAEHGKAGRIHKK